MTALLDIGGKRGERAFTGQEMASMPPLVQADLTRIVQAAIADGYFVKAADQLDGGLKITWRKS